MPLPSDSPGLVWRGWVLVVTIRRANTLRQQQQRLAENILVQVPPNYVASCRVWTMVAVVVVALALVV